MCDIERDTPHHVRDEEDGVLVEKESTMEKEKVQEAMVAWRARKRQREEDGEGEVEDADEDVQDVQVCEGKGHYNAVKCGVMLSCFRLFYECLIGGCLE